MLVGGAGVAVEVGVLVGGTSVGMAVLVAVGGMGVAVAVAVDVGVGDGVEVGATGVGVDVGPPVLSEKNAMSLARKGPVYHESASKENVTLVVPVAIGTK